MATRISIESINTSMIAASAEQEASSGMSKVWDASFPLMATPINRKILVYIPKDVEQRKVELLIHDTRKGKSYGQARCISGLEAGFESIGYTGECPYCKATEAAWELYNLKLDQKAAELGVSRDNDPDDLLKGTKETLRHDMAVKNADKYIVFPVVIIPSDASGNIDNEAVQKEGVHCEFVLWRKQRYMDKFSDEVLDDRTTPAGTFERWSFVYDTKGKQPDAMNSAKALTIKIIEKPDQLAVLEPLIEACEKVAEPFTQLKAIDNIKALNYYSYADVEKEAESIIKPTRLLLAASQTGIASGTAPAIAAPTPAPALGTAEAAVANFGSAPAPVAQGVDLGGIGQVTPAQTSNAAVSPTFATPQMPTFGG